MLNRVRTEIESLLKKIYRESELHDLFKVLPVTHDKIILALVQQTMKYDFTNEGGVNGTIRFLKNIMGLWLLQQCRKTWAVDRTYSYDELTQIAEEAAPFTALVDPNCSEFLNPPNMPEAIRQFCQKSGQTAPDSVGDISRCILESLALEYRSVLDKLRQVYSRPINRVHIIGGGTQNKLLCQFAANATGLPVVAGPIEATAFGNILVQAMALGYVSSLAELRDIVRRSVELERYEPQETKQWEAAYERFQNIKD